MQKAALLFFVLILAGCDAALPGTVNIPGGQPGGSSGTPTTAPSTPTPVVTLSRPDVEVGVAVPRWSTNGYGASDKTYQKDLSNMAVSTGSRWVTLVFNLYEASYTSTEIGPGSITPPAANLAQGIEYAHSLGLKVYVEPILRVGTDGWGGWLSFSDPTTSANWFNSYYDALTPYLKAAQQAGAEQMSIGTELQDMEWAGNGLWENFISKVHSIYHGQMIYGVNYNSSSVKSPPAWMRDSDLFALGISAWWPINVDTSHGDPDVATILAFWRSSILPIVDNFSEMVGHKVIFSEIGYRDARDALQNPFNTTSTTPADPMLQATAYAAAAQAAFGDTHIVGILFWAWKNDLFSPTAPSVLALYSAFRSPAA